jgi:hypothetical protein
VQTDHGIDPFAHAAPFRARRNPARWWTAAAVGIAAVLLMALAALLLAGPHALRGGIGAAAAPPLDIQVTRKPQRRMMESGNELLEITGRVRNPTAATQTVPDIRAELRDAAGHVVYGWTIAAPVRALAPKASADFDSAEVDVPRGSKALNLSFAGDADR